VEVRWRCSKEARKNPAARRRPCADGGIPRQGRWRGGSQRRPRNVTAMTTCSDATARWDDVAAGRESVQRRENHQRRTCGRRHVDSRRRGPKAATLQPEGATQRQPDARTVVGACSGTYLAETCIRSVDQTDGGAVRQVLDDGTQNETHGVIVGEVPGDGGEDGRRWRPRRRGAGIDAPRRPSDDASDIAARLVKASRPAQSRRRQDDRGSLPR
jgi:hypothetical protein